jgi:acetylornithine deacetylase/succinyl-diaminopimelate desuccinylase-like protein
MDDLLAALELAEALREQVGEPATNVRFQLVVDEYVRVGQNFTRLGESLNLTRQRAQQLVAQARKRGIVIPPKK